MDNVTLGAAIAIMKTLDTSSVAQAIAAAESASASADRAATYACSVSISGKKMIITTAEEE